MASFEIQIITTHDIEVDDAVIKKYIKDNNGDVMAGLRDWACAEGMEEASDFGEKMVKVYGDFNGSPVRFEL